MTLRKAWLPLIITLAVIVAASEALDLKPLLAERQWSDEVQLVYTSEEHVTSWNCSSSSVNSTCPSWHYCDHNGQCSCEESLHDLVKCKGTKSLLVLHCFCATYNNNTFTSELGQCLFNCAYLLLHTNPHYSYDEFSSNVTEINDILCSNYSREGTLCGRCKDGYYPLAYSYNLTCVKCESAWYKWIEYFAMVYIPLTIFYFLILFFQINTTSSYLLGFVLYSQFVSFPQLCRVLEIFYHDELRFKIPAKIGMSLYGIWNLDFFRILNHSTCLRTSSIFISVLDVFSGIYPLFLVFITYIAIWLYDNNFKLLRVPMRPCKAAFKQFRGKFEIRTSLIDAFSTFFLLSNAKFFYVAFDLLASTKMYILNSKGDIKTENRLYLYGDLVFFSDSHIWYGILGVIVFLVSIVMPTLFLFVYPFKITQKCLTVFGQRSRIVIHTFMDTFQGSFKDGMQDGGMDYRWFSIFYYVIRFFAALVYMYTFSIMYFALGAITLVLLSMAIIALQPFKDNTKHNFLTPSFLLHLSCIHVCIVGYDLSYNTSPGHVSQFLYISVFMYFTPILYVSVIVVYWLLRQTKPTKQFNLSCTSFSPLNSENFL